MNSLPATLTSWLKEKKELDIVASEPVGGGSINQAALLRTSDGPLFLKWNNQAPADFFEKEADGLALLRSANTGLRIPDVLATRPPGPDRPGFLLLEYVEPVRGGQKAAEQFGIELAGLHKHSHEMFGLGIDNYIGELPQKNLETSDWPAFFINQRIEPQLQYGIDHDRLPANCRRGWDRLAGQLDSLFPASRPSLLHGDLWSGNYFFDHSGQTVLVDPAVYYGHPEMELSFTRMFGGFSSHFYDSYASVKPLEPGFSERVDIYNLYPLLVHANLFGGSYSRQVSTFLNRFE